MSPRYRGSMRRRMASQMGRRRPPQITYSVSARGVNAAETLVDNALPCRPPLGVMGMTIKRRDSTEVGEHHPIIGFQLRSLRMSPILREGLQGAFGPPSRPATRSSSSSVGPTPFGPRVLGDQRH